MLKFRYWILFFISQSLFALTTLHVTTNTDNNPGETGDVGDLRYCLNTMNQGLFVAPDDYAIVFDFPMTIQLNGILPVINNSSNPVNITIGNPGSTPTVTVDGNSGAYSGFFIPMGNVTIQNMIFQNMTAKGGDGGNGISGGGGGLGAGGAIYVPQTFLNGANPSVTLMNVSINNCSAVGGNGGSYLGGPSTGDEGGGGGGGLSGNGGSITTNGITGGAGGGGFGGNGGDVTLSTISLFGGGGGGGGGIGSRATIGSLKNLGDGGPDQNKGLDGSALGIVNPAGAGAGGFVGGNSGGGGGGGAPAGMGISPGGGGGGSIGTDGLQTQGGGGGGATPSGGNGGDGAGGGGGGVVTTILTNGIDGQAGNGGYGGGGGGGAGTGFFDVGFTVQGGVGGIGGGGGGAGVDQSGTTPADGGNSLGGGGGGGAGPSNGLVALGGSDVGGLGGGSGGVGAGTYGAGFGGGGGGGGSALGGAIFVDSNLNFTVQAMPGIPTIFNTVNTTTQAGNHGTGGAGGGTDGLDGSAWGNSIFLRSGSSLTFMAQNANDLLTLGGEVAFTDETNFGGPASSVFVRGNGTVIYNGTTGYQGNVLINNANFKVNGLIDQASISVCRNSGFSAQRGTLSGIGVLSGSVFANSGTISPDTNGTLTLGSLTLSSANLLSGSIGSLVHTEITTTGTSLIAVTGTAALAGTLEINIDPSAAAGAYTLLTSSGIIGTFDSITFTGQTPSYTLSYLPNGAPTYVQFNLLGFVDVPATLNGTPISNSTIVPAGRPIILGDLPVAGAGATVYTVVGHTGDAVCQIGRTETQTYLKITGTNGSCTITGTKNGTVTTPFTVRIS